MTTFNEKMACAVRALLESVEFYPLFFRVKLALFS